MRPEEQKHRLEACLRQAKSHYASKRYADAISSYDEAISLLRKIGTKVELGTCLLDRANCLYVISHLKEAVRDYDEALPCLKKWGAPENHISCLMNRALCHFELDNIEKALQGFDGAIELFRRHQVGDGFARCVMYRAHCLSTLDRHQEAIAGYDEAALLLRAEGLFAVLANCLRNRANCTYWLGKKEEALTSWEEAIPLFREYGPRTFLEESLINRATCLSQLGYFDKSIMDLNEVLLLLREHESSADLAKCMMIRALCLDQVGPERDALEAYDAILMHFRTHGPRTELANCLMNRAAYLRRRGHWVEALSGFDEIIRDFRSVVDRNDLAQCLMGKGNCLIQMGRGEAALSYHNQALVMLRESGSNGDLADCLMNRAVGLHYTGQLEEALQEFDKAIRIYRNGEAMGDLAQCLMNRASCLNSLGRWKDSLAAHNQALILLREHGDPVNVAGCLLNRADCVRQIGEAEDLFEALLGLEEALEIFREHGTPADVAQCVVSRSTFLGLLGKVEDSLAELRAALPLLQEHGRPDNVAGCLMNQGIGLGVLGKYEDALKSYDMALPIVEAYGTAGDITNCLMGKASCLASLERHEDALAGFDRAFASEDRASTILQDHAHRILAREQNTDRYRFATQLALDLEQPERAWGYVQRGKGRTLLDLLAARSEMTALDRQELLLVQQRDAGLVDESTFAATMTRIGDQRQAQQTARLGTDPRAPVSLDEVVAVLQPGEVLLDAFTTGDDGELSFFLLRPGLAAVAWVGEVDGEDLSALTDRWASARSQWLDAFSAKATILTSTNPAVIARRDTFLARGDYDRTMATAAVDEQQVLAELGELIFATVLAQLDEAATTLIVSPDGLLHRLPVAAVTLPDAEGRQVPLIDRIDLQLVPTASSLAILRGPHGPRLTWPAALLAAAPFATEDPTRGTRSVSTVAAFSQKLRTRLRFLRSTTPDQEAVAPAIPDRLDLSGPLFPVIRELMRAGQDPGDGDLPHSGPEIVAVADQLRAVGCPVKIIATSEATRHRLESELPAARILHLATHGGALATNETVMDYRIFLADDTDLRIHELYDGTISLSDVMLVNLSACSLGEVMLQGAEAVGFMQAFLQAGAGVVLAPLWAVEDQATMLLMVKFYEVLTAPDRPTVAFAWRRACTWIRSETPYTHPIFWAGFLPSGDASLRLPALA